MATCSYCAAGMKPAKFITGWMHPSEKFTSPEKIKDGVLRLVLCINKHPKYAEKWKDMQLTSPVTERESA